MRSTKLVTLLLALVPTAFGCGDDIIFPDQTELPPAALNGVFPAKGFTDRTLRVEISGDGTAFDSGSTVSFGDGITVGEVEVSSTGTLFANITITGDAALGKRDVTVTNADATTLTLTAAFDVQAPLEVALDGPLLQGGIGFFLIINKDPESPFLGDLTVTAGAGTTISVDDQTENLIQGTVFLDVDAASGPLVVTDTLLDTITSRAAELTVTPRTPTALQSPGKGPTFQATNVTMTATTSLFSFEGDSAMYRATSGSEDFFAPLVIWLPDGKWANSRGFVTDDVQHVPDGETMFIVTADEFLDTGFAFDLTVDDIHALPGVSALAEVEDNDALVDDILFENHVGTGTAQALAQDQTLFTGVLGFATGDGDIDVLSVTLEEGEGLHITTTTGSTGFADTVVAVYDDIGLVDFNDDIDFGAGVFASDLVVSNLPAGDYQVVIFSAVTAFDDPYEAGISVLPAVQQ